LFHSEEHTLDSRSDLLGASFAMDRAGRLSKQSILRSPAIPQGANALREFR